MKLTIDSNILIYAHDHGEPERQRTAIDLVTRAARADAVLLLQCLGEYFKVAITKLGMPPAEARAAVARWRRVFPIQVYDLSVFDEAANAVELHRLPFWDAMIWAAAREAGCRAILTEDFQDGQVLGGVTFVNPFKPANADIVDRLFA